MQSDRPTAPAGKEREVVETSLKPAYPLISNQPERFGALSEAFLFVEEKRLYELLGKVKQYAILGIVLLALPIIAHVAYRIYSGQPLAGTVMDVAKIIFVYALTGTTVILAAIFIYRNKILEILAQLEDLAYFGDDMARFYMPYLRTELKDINEKLNRHKEEPTLPSSIEVVRDVWPFVSLLLKRDPNILKWGKVGFKVYKTLSAFFKGGHDNNNSGEQK